MAIILYLLCIFAIFFILWGVVKAFDDWMDGIGGE